MHCRPVVQQRRLQVQHDRHLQRGRILYRLRRRGYAFALQHGKQDLLLHQRWRPALQDGPDCVASHQRGRLPVVDGDVDKKHYDSHRSKQVTFEEASFMFCFKCGAGMADTAQACPRCGALVAAVPQSPPPPVPLPGGAAAVSQPGRQYAAPETDGKAIGSLILGILAIFPFGFLAGIPAVVLGHMSKSSIAKSMGRLKGDGMATAGLIMGYFSVAFVPLILIIAAIFIPTVVHTRAVANEAAAASTI